jgi:ankyrin repeat protein
MLVLNHNAINLVVGSRRGKRKATLEVEDQHARNEKKAKQVSQSLIESARKGDLMLCVQAIRDGADISFQSCGLSAVFYAAFYGHNMILEYLVNCGASANEKNLTGVTPLAKAIESGRPDALATVQCLLRHRADPNIADDSGITPLIKAVKLGSTDIVKCLVGHSLTDVNKHNNEKNTALHEAAFKGSKELVDLLIAARADVRKQNSSGKTALHRAVTGNHLSVAKSLLDNGADINVQDSLGYSSGHYAAFFGHLEAAQFLVQQGCNLDLRERIGKKTALELAQERRHFAVAEYLSRIEKVTIPFLSVSYSL